MVIFNALKFEHEKQGYYVCLIDAKSLSEISYVARRGVDQEEGAVQRILNKKRISSIRDFLLDGGFFPNTIILNVVKEAGFEFNSDTSKVSFTRNPRIAQIIDGQHRVEGLKEAIKLNDQIGNMLIPTVLTNSLKTEDCAEIFISINTEQKSVPKSLIYDLYGLMNTSSQDFSIERGTDIAKILNTDDNSPYQGFIKFPGSRKFKGGIQLSTFVNYLKPLVKSDGEFNKYSLTTLEIQAAVIRNYLTAIQSYYNEEWESLNNPFIFASGLGAAVDMFTNKILPYSYSNKKFSESFFKKTIIIPKDKLIKQNEVKGLSGEAARDYFKAKLLQCVCIEETTEDDFEI